MGYWIIKFINTIYKHNYIAFILISKWTFKIFFTCNAYMKDNSGLFLVTHKMTCKECLHLSTAQKRMKLINDKCTEQQYIYFIATSGTKAPTVRPVTHAVGAGKILCFTRNVLPKSFYFHIFSRCSCFSRQYSILIFVRFV